MLLNPQSKLTWEDPTTYTDGSAVSEAEIPGYNIHLGQKSGVYTIVHNVPNSEPDEAILGNIPGLKAGTWFAAISTAATGAVMESALTAEITFDYTDKQFSKPTNFGSA